MFASPAKLASVSLAVMSQASRTGASAAGFTVRSQANAVSFDVVVVPRASRSRIAGLHANCLKISLAAPPVDGEANQALCELIAKLLSVPKRAVQIQRGERSKHKTVRVTGVTVDQVSSLATLTADDDR
jgi:uncharacterized protein (TIGR00251 family)